MGRTPHLTPAAAILAAGMALAGCGAPGDDAGTAETIDAAASTSPDTSETWSAMTTEELETLAREKLTQAPAYSDIQDPPEVETVEILRDHHQQAQQVAACLREAGWDSMALPEGGVATSTETAEDEEGLERDTFECQARRPVDPRLIDTWPRAAYEQHYRHLTKVTAPCVEEQGFTVGAPPDEETFVEEAAADDSPAAPWEPVAAADVPQDELADVVDACPSVPADLLPAA